jgi:hypothetical protein
MPRRMTPAFLTSLLVALLVSQAAWSTTTTYRWVDEKGRVHYGDARPPERAEPDVLDKQGRTVKQLRRQQAAKPDPKAAASRQAEEEQRQRYDRALLSTYVNEAEIDLARDRALILEQANLDGLQKRLDGATARLGRLNAEIEDYRKGGRRVPGPVTQMKKEAQEDIVRLSELILRSNKVVETITGRYEADKQRFRELKSAEAQARPAVPGVTPPPAAR